MNWKVMGTPMSSLQDLKDSNPLAAPKRKATLLERQQEASREEAPLFGQKMDHLLRYPEKLLKDSEEDAVPRTETQQLEPRST